MKNKYIFRIAGVILLLGVILMTAGHFLGAKKSIYIDMKGVHAVGNGIKDMISIKEMDLEKFSNININVASQKVTILNSKDGKYGIDIFCSKNEKIKWEVTNDTLTIKENGGTFPPFIEINLEFLSRAKEKYIIVYIPKDVQMDDVNVKIASGSAIIEDTSALSLALDIGSGKATLEKCKALDFTANVGSGNVKINNSEFDYASIRAISGKIMADHMNSKKTDVYVTSGNVNITGALTGKITAKVVSGEVNLDIFGEKQNYNKTVSVISGSIKIDKEKVENNYLEKSDSENSLDLSATSGNININFIK